MSEMDHSMHTTQVRGLRRSEYDQLVATGAFQDERVELLDGVILRMSPHGPLHDGTLDILLELFQPAIAHFRLRVQSAFAASDGSQPEPDLALVEKRDYRGRHPDRARLIIEVADSSLERDRSIKARIYAQSGVPEYWVVDVVGARVLVFRTPGRDGYESSSTHRAGETLVALEVPGLSVPLDVLFAATTPNPV